MLLLSAAALLLAACSAESVSFSIPVPEFTDSDGKPGHMDIVFQPEGTNVSAVDIYNQYTCIKNQAFNFGDNVHANVKLAENNTWALSGPVEDFMQGVENNCGQLFKANISTNYAVKGTVVEGMSAPSRISLNLLNILLNNTPGAIDKYTMNLSIFTYNFNIRKRVFSSPQKRRLHPLELLPQIDADVIWLRKIPSKLYSDRILEKLKAKYPNCVCDEVLPLNCVLSKLPLDELPELIFGWHHHYEKYFYKPTTGKTKLAMEKGLPLTVEVTSDKFSCSTPPIDISRMSADHDCTYYEDIDFVTVLPQAQKTSSTEKYANVDLYSAHDYTIANKKIFIDTLAKDADAEKAAEENAAKEKTAAEKASEEKIAAEKIAAEKAAGEKAAKEKTDAENLLKEPVDSEIEAESNSPDGSLLAGNKLSSNGSDSDIKPNVSRKTSAPRGEENITQKPKNQEAEPENSALIKKPLTHLGAALIFMITVFN